MWKKNSFEFGVWAVERNYFQFLAICFHAIAEMKIYLFCLQFVAGILYV